MIVHNFDISRTVVRPTEADAPPVVDPDRMLTNSIPLQGFEPIGWRRTQIAEPLGRLESFKLAPGDLEYLNREALGALTVEHRLCNLAFEAPYQTLPLSIGRMVSI
jgi:hypothetical protein